MRRPWRSAIAMMTVSTSPALVWRTSSSSVILAVFSWRRDCPFVRSACVLVDRSRAVVPVRAIANPSCLLETDEAVLDFGVELERVQAGFAADAAALVPAKGRLLVHAPAAVDAEDAGLDAPSHAQRAADVAGPDRPGKTVRCVVDQAQDLILVGEGNDGQHGTENLLLRDPHPILGPVEDGGLEEAAGREVTARRRSPGEQARALLAAHPDIALHPLAPFPGDQGSDFRAGIERTANGQFPSAVLHPPLDLLRDRAMDKGTAAGAAVLSRIPKDAVDRSRGGLLEIRIRKDDVG